MQLRKNALHLYALYMQTCDK